jgi:hypothetical protein
MRIYNYVGADLRVCPPIFEKGAFHRCRIAVEMRVSRDGYIDRARR